MTLRIPVLTALLLLIPAAACAQPAPPAGIDPGRLAMRTDSMHIHLVRGKDRQRLGMQWDQLSPGEHEGVPALVRIYRTTNTMFGPHLDTIVSRLPDLKPLYRSSRDRTSARVAFGADSIRGFVLPQGGPRRSVSRPADPALYDAGTFDLLVRASPLAEGWEVSVPAYLATHDETVRLRAWVKGSESVAVEGGRTVDAWVVEMDFAGLSSTLWIEKRGRSLARQVIRFTPDAYMLIDRS